MKNNKYSLNVLCSNCNYKGPINIEKGKLLKNAKCLECKCQTLIKRPKTKYGAIKPKQENFS